MANCRSCGQPLQHTVCDLGLSPISNAFVRQEDLDKGEMFYPLKVCVCDGCWLVQLDSTLGSDAHFRDDYVYFSSFSPSWLAHARQYVDMMTARFGLSAASRVIEVASNDGYLLQYFAMAGIPALGIEPTASTAAAARARGIETLELFFGRDTAAGLAGTRGKVDLLLGNNVLAHVPDINDFVGGMPLILADEGVVTLEFPHLLNLVRYSQFDTIYHEHYSYLSLTALMPVFARAGLRVFDVEELTTHGGSLRVFACLAGASHREANSVGDMLEREQAFGLASLTAYEDFRRSIAKIKRSLVSFLLAAREEGKVVAAYGAAAKGNTLLNYCGIRADLIAWVADKNDVKQGKYLPGSRIPVVHPDTIAQSKPDYLLILPWNIKSEIMSEMAHIRDWGGKFAVPIPALEIVA